MLPFLDERRDRVWTVAMHAKVWAGHHRTNVSQQEPWDRPPHKPATIRGPPHPESFLRGQLR
jgi:hypothetical protein